MNTLNKHIISASVAILVIALMTPTVVKFCHIFEDHIHFSCDAPYKSHYHEADVECELHKFNKTNQFHLANTLDFEITTFKTKVTTDSYYSHLISHRQLSFSLRAPPSA